jgi:hypothetical protein
MGRTAGYREESVTDFEERGQLQRTHRERNSPRGPPFGDMGSVPSGGTTRSSQIPAPEPGATDT